MSLSAETAKRLAEARLSEGQGLLEAGHFSGAYYIAGYAVELALKVVVAKQFQANEIPDKKFVDNTYSHDLAKLLGLADLQVALKEAGQAAADLEANWLVATQWSEASRYAIMTEAQARELVRAIDDPATGVFQWLKSHW